MSNRYVTQAERDGTKRRMAEYRQRLAAQGIRTRSIALTDAEYVRLRLILAIWRSESVAEGLSVAQVKAASLLSPIK